MYIYILYIFSSNPLQELMFVCPCLVMIMKQIFVQGHTESTNCSIYESKVERKVGNHRRFWLWWLVNWKLQVCFMVAPEVQYKECTKLYKTSIFTLHFKWFCITVLLETIYFYIYFSNIFNLDILIGKIVVNNFYCALRSVRLMAKIVLK